MSFKFNGTNFHSIVKDGTNPYGNYKINNVPIKYTATTDTYKNIQPRSGDITDAFKIPTAITNMETAASTLQTATSYTATLTAPSWANSFKAIIKSVDGSYGPFYPSTQASYYGPNISTPGWAGKTAYVNDYVPLTANKNVTVALWGGDNGGSEINCGDKKIRVTNGGHGYGSYGGHQKTAASYNNPGPDSTAEVTNIPTANFVSSSVSNATLSATIYWFS